MSAKKFTGQSTIILPRPEIPEFAMTQETTRATGKWCQPGVPHKGWTFVGFDDLGELPTPADKAAALEAILTGELAEDDPSFTYRQLGERLQNVKEKRDAGDEAT